VSRQGFDDGVFFALRLGVMWVASASFLSASTPESMARGAFDVLRRFSRDAAERTALFVFLAIGFVPLLKDEFARVRVAQSFRTGPFSGNLWRRADVVRSWVVPILVSVIHRSGELAKTVELRSIRERLVRSIEPPATTFADAVLILAMTAAAIVASR
jgi:energy-coupling factor transporter transmembrane protein EcfT